MSLFEQLPRQVTIERQIAEVLREISIRRDVYPKWVRSGRMKQDEAESRVAAMEAVKATLEKVRETEDPERREQRLARLRQGAGG